MKNGLFIRLFILLLLVSLAFGGCTAKSNGEKDSAEEDQIKELAEYSTAKETIGVKDNQKLIGYYRLPLADMFDTDSIEEILTSEYVLNIYYLVEQNGKIIKSYACEEGDISRMSVYPPEAEPIPVLLNEVLPEQLPDNAEVLDVYFLDGELSHHGTALYVRTNKGDFVYYNYFLTSQVLGKQQTFFTKSEFFDLMRAVNKAEREAWGYTDEPNWLPIVIGTGVAVAVGGVVAFFVIRKKKAKAKENA